MPTEGFCLGILCIIYGFHFRNVFAEAPFGELQGKTNGAFLGGKG